jgi:hypothetical protein
VASIIERMGLGRASNFMRVLIKLTALESSLGEANGAVRLCFTIASQVNLS